MTAADEFSTSFDSDIESMFEENNVVEESKSSTINSETASPVTFGGEVNASAGYGFLKETVFERGPWSSNILYSIIYADTYLDIRLSKGIKSYLSTTFVYIPGSLASEQLSFILNEAFIDFNFNYDLFVRFGKQVSKWGRGFFWNPTDFINEDRKQFSDLNRTRQGSYGLRLHLPIETVFNGYAFLGTSDISSFEGYALSIRAETLLGNVELGLLAWLKPNRRAIFGGDFSFGTGGFNIYGEGTLHQETTMNERLIRSNKILTVSSNRETIFFGKVVVGANKSFKRDTINLGVEFFYNGEGYNFNSFQLPLADEVTRDTAYQAFEHNQWYGALFLTFTELFRNTSRLSINSLINFLDGSIYLSPWLIIEPVNQFQIAITPLVRIGNGSFTEMTFDSSNPLNNIFLNLGFLLTLSF